MTAFFSELDSRIKKLDEIFLPKKLSPTGNYKYSTYERVRAFKVLSHTEFEVYFESLSYTIAKNAYQKWTTNNIITKPLLAMALYYSGSYSAVPESKGGNHSSEDLNKKIHMSFSDYSQKKARNNGIKEKDILQLLLPIGIEVDQIDNNLLIALNNYGSKRGEMVHSNSATQYITPGDARFSTNELLGYIQNIDGLLALLL